MVQTDIIVNVIYKTLKGDVESGLNRLNEKFKKLGDKVGSVFSGFKGDKFSSSLKTLTESFNNSEESLRQISELQVGNNFLDITNKGDKLRKTMDKINKNSKKFKTEWLGVLYLGKRMEQTFGGMLAPSMEMVGVFDVLNTMLGMMFLPIAMFMLDVVMWLWDAWDALPEPIKGFVMALVVAGLAIGIILDVFGTLETGLWALKQNWGAMASAIGGVLSNPIFWIILAIIAAVIILNEMWKSNTLQIRQHWGNFLIWFSGVFDTYLKPIFNAIGNVVIVTVNSIIFAIRNLSNYWSLYWNSIKLVAFTIWNAIASGIEGLGNSIINFINGVIKVQKWAAGTSIGKALGMKAWEELPELNFSSLKADTESTKSAIADAYDKIKNSAVDSVETMNKQLEQWKNMMDGVSPSLVKMGNDSIEMGNKIDSGAVKGTGFLEDAMGSLKNMFSDTTSTLNNSFIPAMDNTNTNVNTVYNSIDNSLTPAINDNYNAFQGLKNPVDNINLSFGSVNDTIDAGTTAWNTYKDTATTSVERITSDVNTLKTAIQEYTKALNDIPKQIGTTITKTIYTTEYYSKKSSGFWGWLGLQHGGLVTKPTPALIGERGPEAVIPLDRIGSIGGINITINTSTIGGNTDQIARDIADKFAFELSRVRY